MKNIQKYKYPLFVLSILSMMALSGSIVYAVVTRNPNHPEAGHVYEVFSGRNIMEARDYAKSLSTPTKQLFDLQEYEVPGDAMTY